MLSEHKVNNVTELRNYADQLLQQVVSNNADSILDNLRQAIENIKANWKGKDAGLRIQEIIKVHNSMVELRNKIAQYAVDTSKVAVAYREAQNAGGANFETLTTLSFDVKTNIPDYSDLTDTIDINPSVEAGKRYVDAANDSMDELVSNFEAKKNEIMSRWIAGPGRDAAEDVYNLLKSSVVQHKQTLTVVSSNISKALQNYTM